MFLWRSLFLFPCGFHIRACLMMVPAGYHIRACLMMVPAGFRRVWPNQRHRQFMSSSSAGYWSVLCQTALTLVFKYLTFVLGGQFFSAPEFSHLRESCACFSDSFFNTAVCGALLITLHKEVKASASSIASPSSSIQSLLCSTSCHVVAFLLCSTCCNVVASVDDYVPTVKMIGLEFASCPHGCVG